MAIFQIFRPPYLLDFQLLPRHHLPKIKSPTQSYMTIERRDSITWIIICSSSFCITLGRNIQKYPIVQILNKCPKNTHKVVVEFPMKKKSMQCMHLGFIILRRCLKLGYYLWWGINGRNRLNASWLSLFSPFIYWWLQYALLWKILKHDKKIMLYILLNFF